jgi:hypothetical protein
MKVILTLVAFCLFSFTFAAGQNSPPASGPVGPSGPANQPPARTPVRKHGRARPAQPGDLIALAPPKSSTLPNFARWFAFESPGGGYTLTFPAKPTSDPGVPVPEAPGLTQYRTWLNAGANRYFEANYFDFHGQLNAPELALEGGVSSLVNQLIARGFDVADRRSGTIGGCPSKEATLQTKPGDGTRLPIRIRIRTLYSGDKVYVLTAQAEVGSEDAEAIDSFIDSFAVTGGCVGAIGSTTPRKITNGELEGTLDPTSGWQRVDTDYGISFLLPTAAATEKMDENALGRNVHKFSYLSAVNGVVFSVEILDTLPMAPIDSGAQADTVIDTMLYSLRQNLAKDQIVVGVCTPQPLRTVPGRECAVTRSGSDVKGKSRVLVTSKSTFILMALRETETTDQSAEDRFFNSVTIDPK